MIAQKINIIAACAMQALLMNAVEYDLNGDGVLDRLDYNILTEIIVNQNATYESSCDFDGNGVIDAVDANLMLEEIKTLQDFIVNDVSFKMIPVAGGTFIMGATAEQEEYAQDQEKPTHQVTLSSYRIGQTEVTQALWVAVMGNNSSENSVNLQLPVKCSWNDCQLFISKLNELTGKTFRLPTEAEWEYAARGGIHSQGYIYAGSNNVFDVAWYSYYGVDDLQPVATKKPNELGLYDMSGNAWEWCQDWYGDYTNENQYNPTGPETGTLRVFRGGCYYELSRYCRVSYRWGWPPSTTLGFRLAL